MIHWSLLIPSFIWGVWFGLLVIGPIVAKSKGE